MTCDLDAAGWCVNCLTTFAGCRFFVALSLIICVLQGVYFVKYAKDIN